MPRMPTTTAAAISATVPLGSAADRVGDVAERPPRVDAADPASVSFPPHGGAARDARPSAGPADEGHEGHAGIAVGPGAVDAGAVGSRASARGQYRRSPGILDVSGLPVHGAKIHCPLLPATTLSRERLNGWLDEHAAGRIVVIVAEAGFGKTTLLADWSRRTQRRCLWYRLEPDDRDWLGFVRHVVGSGRELDDTFMPRTLRLLSDMGPGGPTRDTVVDSFVAELASEAAADPNGITLILDDYHAIDGNEETTPIVRRLLDQTGDGFSLIVSTRSKPALPLGRLRARGGVARLEGEDLCFERDETDRLFRVAYGRPLEPDVVEDLVDRTDGWPAALHLVRTAIDDRTPHEARTFIRELSGARGELHDFLAEEVVGSLPMELQQFLMRTAILEAVDPRAVPVVDPPSAGHVPERVARAETLGLLARPDFESPHRFHPLVRDFLQARLLADVGADRVREMHLEVGRHFEGVDWRISATHYSRGGDQTSVDRVVEDGIDVILSVGEYRLAANLLQLAGRHPSSLAQHLLQSRIYLQVGAVDEAVRESNAAVEDAVQGHDPRAVVAWLNAAAIAMAARQYGLVLAFATSATDAARDAHERELAAALASLVTMSQGGDMVRWAMQLDRLLNSQLERGQHHYAAISHLNLAQVRVWLDAPGDSLRHAGEAQRLLAQSSNGYEQVSVSLVRAHALALLSRWDQAQAEILTALESPHPEGHFEAMLEGCQLYAWFGDEGYAEDLLQRVRSGGVPAHWQAQWDVLALWLSRDRTAREVIRGRLGREPDMSSEVGAAFRWHLTVARSHLQDGDFGRLGEAFAAADQVARHQKSPLQRRLLGLLDAVASSAAATSRAIVATPDVARPVLSIFAAEIALRLHELSDDAVHVIRDAARANPDRWRGPIRREVIATSPGLPAAAELLAEIGERSDISLLRGLAKVPVARRAADQLTRHLAPKVFINDLGRVQILVGGSLVHTASVRRKVLALLCFLIAAPGGTSSRDAVMDALWPELPPELALNSLNQTIYFLRRVFDPGYRAGVSPEYVRFESELIWLDSDLVDTRSWICRRVLSARPDTQRLLELLLDNYQGKWATEFSYEEWAEAYRDGLHAAFLSEVQRMLTTGAGGSSVRWRLWLAQRALAIDPNADEIEVALIRLYRSIGANAAASEQYSHYAATIREELGVEPPPLEDL